MSQMNRYSLLIELLIDEAKLPEADASIANLNPSPAERSQIPPTPLLSCEIGPSLPLCPFPSTIA